MKNLARQKELLQVLRTATPKLRAAIIKNSDNQTVKALVEIVVNLLKGNIPLTNKQKSNLEKYRNKLRQVYRTCYNCKKQKISNINKGRKLIIQTGGFFPAIIPILAPLIAKAAIGGVIGAASGYATKKLIEK